MPSAAPAPTLVLLHAFPLNSVMYDRVAGRMAAVYDLVVPDLRGFGRATGREVAVGPSLSVLADDVLAELDARGVERAVIGGTSMGGYVALALAGAQPERVAGLVLANTKAEADAPEAAANRLRIADEVERDGSVDVLRREVAPKLLGATSRQQRPEVVGTVAGLVDAASPAGVAWAQRAMAARADTHDVLRGLEAPVVVIAGAEDELMPRDAARSMAEAARNATLVTIADAGHLACLETPDAFSDAVSSVVDQLRA